MAHVSAAFEQASFRGRNDDGSESTATWKAAANVDWIQGVDETFRVRFLVRETAGGSDNNHQPQLQYNRNSAGWNDVNGTSSVVRSSASGNFADDDHTTQQLGSGTFITPNDGMDEDNGLAGENNNIDFSGNDEVEVEYSVQILSADVSDADTVELRVISASAGVYDVYTSIPSVTVSVAPQPQVRTVTLSLDSVLQQQFQLAASFEAAVQDRIARETALTATLLEAQSRLTNLNAAVEALNASVSTFDAALRETAVRTTGLNGGVALGKTRSGAIDAALATRETVTFAMDGALRRTSGADASLDAAIYEALALSAGLQAAVESGQNVTASLDATLLKAVIAAASLDAFVQVAVAGEAVSLSLDALLQVAETLQTGLSAALRIARQAATALEAAVQQDKVLALNLSGGVARARTVTQSLDALLVTGRTLVVSLSAAIRARQLIALGLDAALGVPFSPRPTYRVPGRPRHEVAGREAPSVPERGTCGIGSDGRVYVIPPRDTVH